MEIADSDGLKGFTLLPGFTCFHRLGPDSPTVGSHLSEPTISPNLPSGRFWTHGACCDITA